VTGFYYYLSCRISMPYKGLHLHKVKIQYSAIVGPCHQWDRHSSSQAFLHKRTRAYPRHSNCTETYAGKHTSEILLRTSCSIIRLMACNPSSVYNELASLTHTNNSTFVSVWTKWYPGRSVSV
jgi:hypothetical protein